MHKMGNYTMRKRYLSKQIIAADPRFRLFCVDYVNICSESLSLRGGGVAAVNAGLGIKVPNLFPGPPVCRVCVLLRDMDTNLKQSHSKGPPGTPKEYSPLKSQDP